MSHDTPEAIPITDKAARDVLEVEKLRSVNAKLFEACKLADALFEGANINMSTFERKLKAAIKQAEALNGI
jgi:hypothetical protein